MSNDRLSLMSLKIIQCLLQLLHGMMLFCGHGERQSVNFNLGFFRLRCLAELIWCFVHIAKFFLVLLIYMISDGVGLLYGCKVIKRSS